MERSNPLISSAHGHARARLRSPHRGRRFDATGAALWLVLVVGCQSPPPEFEEPDPADVLYEQGIEALEGTSILGLFNWPHIDTAIESFQGVIDNYPYSDYAVLAELKIADAYYEDDKYEEALSYYRDFADLHPQHEQVPYTIFRSALCYKRQVRTINRDQTATREALFYLDRLLNEFPYSEYSAEAEEIWRELRTHLAKNVMSIADFYRGRDEFESAAERYRSLLSEYPGLGLDAESLYKLGLCYAAMNRPEEAERQFLAIVQNYHGTDFADAAADRIAALQ
jgi:outer membrane protein assembly factor BamD